MPEDIIKFGRVRFKVKEVISPAYRKLALRTHKKQKRFMKDFGNSMENGTVKIHKKRSSGEGLTYTDPYINVDPYLNEAAANFNPVNDAHGFLT